MTPTLIHVLPAQGKTSQTTCNIWFLCALALYVMPHPNRVFCDNAGHCSRGRDECIQGSEGGVSGDRRVSIRPSAQIPPNSQHHCSWEELHHHLPSAHGRHESLHEEMIAEYSQSLYYTKCLLIIHLVIFTWFSYVPCLTYLSFLHVVGMISYIFTWKIVMQQMTLFQKYNIIFQKIYQCVMQLSNANFIFLYKYAWN